MPAPARKPVDSYRRDAARLLKAAKDRSPGALEQFAALDNPPPNLQLKHALAVIASQAGFESWAQLKNDAEAPNFSEFFTSNGRADSINHWFSGYAEARAHHELYGGVLLPFRHQCFVTSLEILGRIGFEKDDPDWREIGYDFITPRSDAALSRIKAKLTRRYKLAPLKHPL